MSGEEGESVTSKRRELLEARIRQLESALDALPDGRLQCAWNGNKSPGDSKGARGNIGPSSKSSKGAKDAGSKGKYVKWYLGTGKDRVYLPKSERALAEQLALRRLYTVQLSQLRKEAELLEKYELFHEENVYSNEIQYLISKESPYHELLKNNIVGRNDAFCGKKWQEAQYEANYAHPEHLQHKSLRGERLRSKSEVIIANALYMNHIPYRYECGLVLGEVTLYPDFTILHPVTGEIYYWEHFGMMNQTSYREKTWQKLRLYGEHGIFPFRQLLTTYETEWVALDSEMIQKIIDGYLAV